MREEYSPYKFVHHSDKIKQMKKGEQPVPLQVQMMISDLCNHNCSFCAYRMEGFTSNQNFGEWDSVKGMINNNPNRMIPYEKVLEILDDCVDMGVKAIQFTGGGEPTVHPKHKEIFQYTIDRGLELALVTNGYLLRKGVPDVLSHASWVRISLDASNSESYSKIRELPKGSMEKTLVNIEKIVKAKADNKTNVIIGIGFVVTKENYKEVYDAIKIGHDLGVDNVRVSAAFTTSNIEYHAEIYQETREEILRAKSKFEDENFTVFNLFGDRIQDLVDQHPEYKFCPYMHLNTYIGGDLNVYACCNTAYNKIGEMGSIKNMRFKDFWFSGAKKNRYNKLDPRQCPRCMFNNKNRFINYCISDMPRHINFI